MYLKYLNSFYLCGKKQNTEGINPLANFARYEVRLRDKNDNIPRFVGRDPDSRYIGAVQEGAALGTTVVFVSAIDDDGTSPNNQVCCIKVRKIY